MAESAPERHRAGSAARPRAAMPAAAQASCRRRSFEIGRGMWRRAFSSLQELGDGCLLNLSAIRVIDRYQIGQRELLLLKPCAHIFARLGNGRLVVAGKHAAHGGHNAVRRCPRQKILDHLCHARDYATADRPLPWMEWARTPLPNES